VKRRQPRPDLHLVGNRDMAIHCPGACVEVLRRLCEERTHANGDAILLSSSPEQLVQLQREHAERAAAMMRERMGEPVLAHSAHLPSGLPAPFQRWPRG
jgi:hypothetical protein